jgi:outer membrane protein insertion porin family
MNFQPSWNVARLCFLADEQCCRALAIIRDSFSDCLLVAGLDRDRIRLGGRPIIPEVHAATLANDVKRSAYIVGSVLPVCSERYDRGRIGCSRSECVISRNPPFLASLQPLFRRLRALRWFVWVLLFGLSGSHAVAQQNEPTSYEGFEGHNVAKVDLSATPTLDVEAFRSFIKQKAAEPFRIAAIRDSVAELQKTKLFSQIQVQIEPQESGLRVLFILEPAYYIGMVFFPGATSVFTYTRLLQTVNILDQTPFVEDLLTQGKDALLHLFETDGFFAASVQPEAQRDETHRVVNIVFHCQLNKRAKIGEINFQGPGANEGPELRRALDSLWAKGRGASLKPGKKYSQARIRKSVDYLRTRFHKEGRLTSIVRFVSSTYQPETNQADVTFEVEPGPLVSIRITGAKVSKRTQKRLIPVYDENSVDEELVNEGQRNLISYFQTKSYLDVKIESHLDQTPSEVHIVYEVTRGARHRIVGVNFEGNKYFDDRELESHILINKEHFPTFLHHGTFSNDMLRKSVASLTALYQNQGFAKVIVQPKVNDREPDVEVTFHISEGEQDKVNSLQIVNNRNEPIKPQTGANPLNIAPGKPYSPHLLENDRNEIIAEYLNRGYLNAHFESSVSPASGNPHLLDVVYTIDPGPQAHVGEVALLGATRTRPKFIRTVTNADVKEGQPLSEGKFLTAESDLYNLGVFDWASIGPIRPIVNQEQEEVLIKVHESKRNTLDVGGGLEVLPRSGNVPVGAVAIPGLPTVSLGSKFTTSQNSYWGPRITFQFARHDLRGQAETAAIGFVVSRLDQRASLTYSDPHLRGSSWSSLFTVSGERTTENPIFTAQLGQASFQVEKALDRKRTKTLRFWYSFQRTNLSNITIPELVLPQDQRVRLSTFSTEYVHDTRDKPLDAHHGVYQTLTFGVTPTALGSSSNFVRFLGQTAFYLPVRPWLTWANNVRLGLAAPFAGSFVPLSEEFFSGGADSLRGFPINGAGPQRPVTVCSNPSDTSTCTLISVPVGGEMLAILNSEARFPIPLKKGLGGVVFYDGGNVYSKISFHQFYSNYSNSIGFGIRYQTPVGPIRIDIGRNLNPIPGVNATQYFVTLGQTF